jgi:hypothetical protein
VLVHTVDVCANTNRLERVPSMVTIVSFATCQLLREALPQPISSTLCESQ